MQDFELRPMGIGEIIDRTFKIYRSNFVGILLFSLLIGGAVNLVVSLLTMGSAAQASSAATAALNALQSGQSLEWVMRDFYGYTQAAVGGSALWANLAAILITPFVTGSITYIALATCHGEHEEGTGWLARVKGMYWKLIGTNLANGLLVFGIYLAVLLLLFFAVLNPMRSVLYGVSSFGVFLVAIVVFCGAIFLSAYYNLLYAVAVQEQRFGFRPIKRTFSLLTRKFWKVLGTMLLLGLLVGLLELAFGAVLAILPPLLVSVVKSVTDALIAPITVIAGALLYLDIRMTTEGYDLELRNAAFAEGAQAPQEEPPSETYYV